VEPYPQPKEKSYLHHIPGVDAALLSCRTIMLDEKNKLVSDLNFRSHPYDTQVAMETILPKSRGEIKAMLWDPELNGHQTCQWNSE
jgi:hypothetical protein